MSICSTLLYRIIIYTYYPQPSQHPIEEMWILGVRYKDLITDY